MMLPFHDLVRSKTQKHPLHSTLQMIPLFILSVVSLLANPSLSGGNEWSCLKRQDLLALFAEAVVSRYFGLYPSMVTSFCSPKSHDFFLTFVPRVIVKNRRKP